MASEPYLLLLQQRLAESLAVIPQEVRLRHASFLRAAQNADGGFSGREGGSDLYYTGFGLRGLAVLDALAADVCQRAADFLRKSLARQASVVDFFSLLYACFLLQVAGTDVLGDSPPDWPDRVAAALETFRAPDGGYAKTMGGPSGSLYHTFLVGLCYQLLGRSLPEEEPVVRFIVSRRREDDGYVEIAAMRRSGTNPTAAAIGLLQTLGDTPAAPRGLTRESRDGTIRFLAGMASVEGGLRGNARVPVADLLSTFTGIWTLDQLGGLDSIDRAAALRYVQALELPGGGFRAGLWDDKTDVEYTFYGLGCLALLSRAAHQP